MAISFKAMTYFTTAVRKGNIAKAAADLNIAASAVSNAIDQVEAVFDLTLITRQRSRGIQANASGLSVARKFDRLLEEYRSVMAEGVDLKQALSGTLRIGYYAPIAPAFLPDVILSCVPNPKDVVLHLQECDNDSAQEGLLNGTYDVILFITEGVLPSVEFDVLIEAPAYCLLPKSHRLAGQVSISMAEIATEPLVVLNRPVAPSYYRRLFDKQSKEFLIAAYASSTEMVRSLVSAGHGCAILNMRPRTSISYSGGAVVELPISDPLPPLTLVVAYDKSRPRRLVQNFVEACCRYFADGAEDRCIIEDVFEDKAN